MRDPYERNAMFKLPSFKKTEPTDLEDVINRLLEAMKNMEPTHADYEVYADQLVKLYKLKEVDSKKRVSADALVAAASSLGGILFILHYEHAHVMTSKAVSFVTKSVR